MQALKAYLCGNHGGNWGRCDDVSASYPYFIFREQYLNDQSLLNISIFNNT